MSLDVASLVREIIAEIVAEATVQMFMKGLGALAAVLFGVRIIRSRAHQVPWAAIAASLIAFLFMVGSVVISVGTVEWASGGLLLKRMNPAPLIQSWIMYVLLSGVLGLFMANVLSDILDNDMIRSSGQHARRMQALGLALLAKLALLVICVGSVSLIAPPASGKPDLLALSYGAFLLVDGLWILGVVAE